jgi:hypothetical protein
LKVAFNLAKSATHPVVSVNIYIINSIQHMRTKGKEKQFELRRLDHLPFPPKYGFPGEKVP